MNLLRRLGRTYRCLLWQQAVLGLGAIVLWLYALAQMLLRWRQHCIINASLSRI